MRRSTRTALTAAAVALAAVMLGACSPSDTTTAGEPPAAPDLQREPGPATDPTPLDASGLRLPYQFDGAVLFDMGWEAPPQHLDGVFLAPVETGDHLTFTAIDSDGTALWTLERPLACAGFTLATTDSGQSLAIINDTSAAPDRISAVTATAYDLHTGAKAWGPVEVPGTHQGPGLVYAEPAAAMGETGPRTALDINTGKIAAEAPDLVIAERDGTVLLQDGDRLRAVASHGDVLWEATLPAGIDQARSLPGSQLGGGLLPLAMADDRFVIIDLATGDVVATGVTSAAFDEATGVLAVTNGTRLWAEDIATGELLWEQGMAPEARIKAAGTAQVYIRYDDSIQVYNVLTGAVTPGYDPAAEGTITVPHTIAPSGAAALEVDGGLVLVTTPTLE